MNTFWEYLTSHILEYGALKVSVLSLLTAFAVLVMAILASLLIRRFLLKPLVNFLKSGERIERTLNNIVHYLLLFWALFTASQIVFPEIAVLGTVTDIMNFKIFAINERPVSIQSLMMFLLIIGVFVVGSKWLRDGPMQNLFGYMRLDQGASYTFGRIIHYCLMIIGGVFAFQAVGIDFSGLAVIFGFLSVGIGFGLQNITSNFVAGIILLLERPIKVGDRVVVGDTEGDVREINMRATTIRSVNNISIIVPNSEFVSANVTNWSHGDQRIRLVVPVGVSYRSDLDLVIRALTEVAEEEPSALKNPRPEVHLSSFGDSSWDMQLRFWIAHPKEWRNVRSAVNCAIVHKFEKYEIEIPFPQRDLHIRDSIILPHKQINGPQNGRRERRRSEN